MKITIRILAGVMACCVFFQLKAQSPPYRPLYTYDQAAGGLTGLKINNKLAVPGYYRTVVGDFNGDSRDDLYLIREAKIGSQYWRTQSLHTFDNANNTWVHLHTFEYTFPSTQTRWLSDDITLLSGDFDNNGRDEFILVNTNFKFAWAAEYKPSSNTWSTPYTFASGKIGGWNIGSDDRFFVGNFDPTTTAVELLAMSKTSNYWKLINHNGTTLADIAFKSNGKIGGFDFSGLDFKACVGHFTGLTEDELFIGGDGVNDTEFRMVSYNSTTKEFEADFESTVDHPTLGTSKIRPGDEFYSGNFDSFTLMGSPAFKDELLIYNRKWRYELRSSDYNAATVNDPAGFYINGNVDYGNYTRPANPKYYEMFNFHLGHFKDVRYTSTLVNLANCAFSYAGGPNCNSTSTHPNAAWSNYNYLPEKIELYHPTGSGPNWRANVGEDQNEETEETETGAGEDAAAENILAFQFEMFPNPASSEVYFNLAMYRESPIGIEIFDLKGKKLNQLSPNILSRGYHQLMIDCSALPAGMYIVKLSNGVSEEIEKLIIQ